MLDQISKELQKSIFISETEWTVSTYGWNDWRYSSDKKKKDCAELTTKLKKKDLTLAQLGDLLAEIVENPLSSHWCGITTMG